MLKEEDRISVLFSKEQSSKIVITKQHNRSDRIRGVYGLDEILRILFNLRYS